MEIQNNHQWCAHHALLFKSPAPVGLNIFITYVGTESYSKFGLKYPNLEYLFYLFLS